MKYFYVTVDKNYIPPMPLAWFGLIDRKTLERKKSGTPPKYMRFFLDESIRMTFTDIITSPCFMASEMVLDVIKRYEPSMKGMRIVLCDKARRKSRAYYIPYLERVWIVSQIKGNPRCMPVERQCLEGRKILEVTDGWQYKVIMRMDMVESILRRDALGIGLEEILMELENSI